MPLGMKVALGPGHIVLDGDLALPTERDTEAPNFRPMSIVAKRWPISATAETLVQTVAQEDSHREGYGSGINKPVYLLTL